MMEYAQREAHPALRADFTRYVGFEERYDAPLRRLEVPFAGAALIISLGPPHTMWNPAAPARRIVRDSFVAGVHDTATVVENTGHARGLEIHFTPLGVRRFLGIPASELTNQIVELEDVLGRPARELVEQLAELPGWEARFDLLESVVLERAHAAPRLPPAVEYAWRRLTATHGGAPVRDLAGELGCSRRHLTRSFGTELGLPPKALGRVLRFQRAVSLIRAGDELAYVAFSCGYYDQPHFNREFRALAQVTPLEFRARALPNGGTLGT
jgi:AraC-like DNA-binding protein